MKALIIFIMFWVAVVNSTSAQTKGEAIVSEDGASFYYTGYSDGRSNLAQAMNEAYLEAVKEAIRHSFGFKQSYIENYLSTTEKAEIYGQMNLTTENIRLQGITPVSENIEKNSDGTYKVMRKIRYLKSERNEEIARQKRTNEKDTVFQKVVSGEGPLGVVTIKTRPNNAQVTLTKDDGKFQVTGSSNVEFMIPIGRYKMNLYKDHHEPFTQEIIVGPGRTPLEFQLTRGTSNVELKITPDDAKVYINGLPVKDHKLSLSVGVDYELRIEHPDFYPENKKFSVWFNENKNIVSSLEPKKGRITIFTQPDDSEIHLDNQYLGEGKIIARSLSPGNYDVTIKRSGFKTHRESITILPNRDSLPLNVTLNKQEEEESEPQDDQSSIWDNFKFITQTHNAEKNELTYTPFTSDGKKIIFYPIPVGYNYNFNELFSCGGEFKWYTSAEDNGTTTSHLFLSTRSKFYPIWLEHFRVGVGLDYNYILESNSNTYETKDRQTNSLGGAISLGVFRSRSDSGQLGINIEYRKHDLKEKNKSIGIGLVYGF